MRYDNPELLRQLAAEYVIGTLDGAARRRFEALLACSVDARVQRDLWEQRLAEFGQVLHPVAPPGLVREKLLRRTAIPATGMRRVAPRRRRIRRARWGYAAGFATAAALVLAFLLGQRHANGPETAARASGMSVHAPSAIATEAASIYAAEVRLPASGVGWLLSITPEHDRLIAVAADDLLQIGRHRVHLWCLVPERAPVSLGDLPVTRHASATFGIPESVRGHAQVSFAITLEPQNSADDSAPSGPVMNQARSLTEL